MTRPVLILGVGGDGPAGLCSSWLDRIDAADELWGSERLLAHWPDYHGSRIVLGSDIVQRVVSLADRGEKGIVILASGDPGLYGIAGAVLRQLAPAEVEIVPHPSSLQVAFARAGIPWSDAILTSAHRRPVAEVVGWARRARKLGILTDPHNTPGHLAQVLLDAGIADCRVIVAENLGAPAEQLIDVRLSQLEGLSFAPLNVMLLLRDESWRPVAPFCPRPDSAYTHRRGLITKQDVRALILARLALRDDDTGWDVGAGSGAVSVEMAELAWRGRIFAVEHDAENLAHIRQNVARFGSLNVTTVQGSAPASLADLPAPDAVFVGGTGGSLEEIFARVAQVARPGCRLVASFATLENLNQALDCAQTLGWEMALAQVNLSYGSAIAGRTRLAPLNPVFIVSTTVEHS